jgi:molecular chaperone GrpE (heat shock protein)
VAGGDIPGVPGVFSVSGVAKVFFPLFQGLHRADEKKREAEMSAGLEEIDELTAKIAEKRAQRDRAGLAERNIHQALKVDIEATTKMAGRKFLLLMISSITGLNLIKSWLSKASPENFQKMAHFASTPHVLAPKSESW